MTSQLINDLLAVLRLDQGRLDSAPCSPEALLNLSRRAESELGNPLPSDYFDLLAQADGVASRGAIIYPSRTCLRNADPEYTYEEQGVVEVNLGLRHFPEFSDFIVLGETEFDWLVWHIFSQTAQARSRATWDVDAQFDRVDALF